MTAFEYNSGRISQSIINQVVGTIFSRECSYDKFSQLQSILGKCIGEGYWSKAWEYTQGSVKYIAKSNFSDRDWNSTISDGQQVWLKWCVENQHNPHVPRIHYLYVCAENERFVVFMEKLKEFRSAQFYTGMGVSEDLASKMADGYNRTVDDVVAIIRRQLNEADFESVLAESQSGIVRRNKEKLRSLIHSNDWKGVVNGVQSCLNNLQTSFGYGRVDMHTGNMMIRPRTGDYVILDPLIRN